MPPKVRVSYAVICHTVSLQYLFRSYLHRVAGLPCRLFLSLWSPRGDACGPSVVFEAVDMPCPVQLHLSNFADSVYDLCPLSEPDDGTQ